MTSNNNAESLHRLERNCLSLTFHLVAILMLISFSSTSPAFGQATYSDSWYDGAEHDYYTFDEDETITGSVTLACSVTDGSYTHDYYVDTTLSSPNGRHAAGSSPRRVGYVRKEVSLPFDVDDTGDFFTNSEHWARCPSDELSFYSIGTTFDEVKIGLSISCYALTGFNPATRTAQLVRIEPCDTRCGNAFDTITFRYRPELGPPQRVVRGEPYTRRGSFVVCGRIGSTVRRVDSCLCGNVETNIRPLVPPLWF